MWRKYGMILLAVWAISVTGCGKSDDAEQPPAGDQRAVGTDAGDDRVGRLDSPSAAAAAFLDAMRNGDDKMTTQLLTTIAREVMAEARLPLSPSRSDTAQFSLGRVEYLSEDGARVTCTRSDLDHNEQRQSQEMVCMVRREPAGWRIAGLCTLVDGRPRTMNFEDREAMFAVRRQIDKVNEINKVNEAIDVLRRDTTGTDPRAPDPQALRPRDPQGPVPR